MVYPCIRAAHGRLKVRIDDQQRQERREWVQRQATRIQAGFPEEIDSSEDEY